MYAASKEYCDEGKINSSWKKELENYLEQNNN